MSRTIGTAPCPKCRDRGHDHRGDNLVLYEDGGAHCFACKYHVFPKNYKLVIKEPEIESALFPSDFTREVPGVAWKWLLQYGLPMSYWRPFVGWSEKDSRLVFTVGEPPVFSIGRLIENEDEKDRALRQGGEFPVGRVSTRRGGKWYVWGDSHKTAYCAGIEGPKTVFVEDVVSAHKVGRVTQSIPIFGTTIYPCHLRLARSMKLPIALWQDKDQQGTTYKKANAISVATGLPCEVIHTDRDPKELTLDQIKEQLNV